MTETETRAGKRFRCAYATACGGCSLTDLGYSDQLAWKQARVAGLLKPFGRVEPIRGMETPFHYRNKVHVVFAADRRGKLITGVYRAGTHQVVPIAHCLIHDSRADAIIDTLRKLAIDFGYAPYDEDRRTGFLRHALVRTGKEEIMVTLVTASATFPSKNAFLKALLIAHPEITTIVQNVNPRTTSMVLGTKENTMYGKGYIEDTLCGLRFRLSSQSFYQVNRTQTEILYALALEMAQLTGKETVLDAYCGVGTIGLTMAARASRLIGVELNAQAVRDAQGNAKRNDIRNATFLCDDAGRFLRRCAVEGAALDVVVMDPPRSGSDAAFLQSIGILKPERVVYVSCDPETLARDLKVLHNSGYVMRRAVPVDMFPATEHVECVVLMSKVQN